MSNETTLFNGHITETQRPGWDARCKTCGEHVRYTILNLVGVEPFLYCTHCSDFVLRATDATAAAKIAKGGAYPTLEQLRAFYKELQATLPPCVCGGTFDIGATPKCPSGHPLDPTPNEEARYFATTIIWLEGALAFRGQQTAAERVRVTEAR